VTTALVLPPPGRAVEWGLASPRAAPCARNWCSGHRHLGGARVVPVR